MKRIALLLAAYLCLAPSLVAANEQQKMPSGVPPHLVTVGRIDQEKGEIDLRVRTVRFVWRPDRTPVYEVGSWTIGLGSTEVFDVEGKKLKSDEFWKRIAVGAVVAVSADAQAVDPAFLRAIAKDTLVLVSAQYAVNHRLQRVDAGPSLLPGSDASPPQR